MSPLGVNVTTSSLLANGGVSINAGTGFFVGLADRGPTTAKLIVSLAQFVSAFGPRTTGNSLLYDSVEGFLREGPVGAACYVARVSDATATAGTLTLNDALPAPKPTVLVTALTPGVDSANTFIEVTNTAAPTFTATTATNTALTVISSTTNLAQGVRITGTGIAAGTYIVSVTGTSAVLSQATTATASGVTITPFKYAVKVEDSAANVLETHGPYLTTAQLYADTSSTLVTFSQSAGSGFTVNQPTTVAAAALTGGADANDITDASYVNALAAFDSTLGPGQVAAPGRTSTTAWTGLLAHGAATNRVACLDLADQTTAAAVVAEAVSLVTAPNNSRSIAATPQCTIPGVTPGTSRTVPASAVVAALCARVHATGNENQAAAGIDWSLRFVTGFTENTQATGGWSSTDLQTLVDGGVNGFTVRSGVPCLYGFRTPSSPTTDAIYWDAAASRERMALVAECQAAAEKYMFATIDGKGVLLAKFGGDLQAIIARHWANGALFGDTAAEAGKVDLSANTLASAQAGQLLAELDVRISPYAESVQISIVSVPVSQALAA